MCMYFLFMIYVILIDILYFIIIKVLVLQHILIFLLYFQDYLACPDLMSFYVDSIGFDL